MTKKGRRVAVIAGLVGMNVAFGLLTVEQLEARRGGQCEETTDLCRCWSGECVSQGVGFDYCLRGWHMVGGENLLHPTFEFTGPNPEEDWEYTGETCGGSN